MRGCVELSAKAVNSSRREKEFAEGAEEYLSVHTSFLLFIRVVSAESASSATRQFNPDCSSLRALRTPSLCVSC